MKERKQLLTIIMTAAFAVYSLGCSGNVYSGSYSCSSNSRLALKLNNDYSFELINTFGKNSECAHGKYTVTDNNIVLDFNKEINIYSFKSLQGKVEGSRLSFDKNKLEFSKR